jgi:hypothetical protein
MVYVITVFGSRLKSVTSPPPILALGHFRQPKGEGLCILPSAMDKNILPLSLHYRFRLKATFGNSHHTPHYRFQLKATFGNLYHNFPYRFQPKAKIGKRDPSPRLFSPILLCPSFYRFLLYTDFSPKPFSAIGNRLKSFKTTQKI